MKNRIAQIVALTGLLLTTEALSAQDIVPLKHKYYTSYFSKSKHIPVMLTYHLSPDMVSCPVPIKRNIGKFIPDPAMKEATDLGDDYEHSGFDRGHNMSAADNGCDTAAMKQCFYFSNMTPQVHSINAGAWKTLEMAERDSAIHDTFVITVGSFDQIKKIGPDSVVVPKYMYKVLYNKHSKQYYSYLFDMSAPNDKDLIHYTTTLSAIKAKTGVNWIKGEPRLKSK